MNRNRIPYRVTSALARVFLAAAALFALSGNHLIWAEDHVDGFEGTEPTWQLQFDRHRMRVIAHRRDQETVFQGTTAELVQWQVAAGGGVAQLDLPLPPARFLEGELTLTLWVRSNRTSLKSSFRVVFPHQIDPRTGRPLVTHVHGDVLKESDRWQQLKIVADKKQLQDQVRRWRVLLNDRQLDLREPYVDQVALSGFVDIGMYQIAIDELHFGPIVPVENSTPAVASAAETNSSPTVELWQDRLMVEGRPFFPRMMAYHNEDLDILTRCGPNMIWVPDYQDRDLLTALRERGLWAAAQPPRVDPRLTKLPTDDSSTTRDHRVDERGHKSRLDLVSGHSAGLVPFDRETEPILLWYQGTRVPVSAKNEVIAWSHQIRNADREFRRPVMADVAGAENVFSRHIQLIGISRHPLGTTIGPKDYRDWLISRRQLAHPGTFAWTWIQTEPQAKSQQARIAAGLAPMVVEPEQLRWQLYAALSAGCRGVGYWKTQPLADESVGSLERQLAVTQLNLELELLEPYLATGSIVTRVPFTVVRPQDPIRRARIDFRNTPADHSEREALLREYQRRIKRETQIYGELEATIIRSDEGILLLPVWYQTDAQFVPGQMAANDATIIVQGVSESASAWEVTTTGIRSLERRRVPGGLQVKLKKFDQTAAVVLLSKDQLAQKERLRLKIERLAETSARVSTKLARAKLERVRQVDSELQQLGFAQPDGHQLLAKANQLVTQADEMLENRDYHGARESSADAMQLLRILQRAHWFEAVRRLSSPVSSPHTICFQTLPDHWRMIRRLGRSPVEHGNNLLASGDFENVELIVEEDWQHRQTHHDRIRAAAELYPAAYEGDYALRMAAASKPNRDAPVSFEQPTVTIRTPPTMVRSGQIVHISGMIRVASAIQGHRDGVVLYDNINGATRALRWRNATSWQPFTLVREVHEDRPLTLTIALYGLGDVYIDNLQIIAHDPRAETPAEAETPTPSLRSRTMDLLGRWPRGLVPGRRSQ